MDNKFSIGDDIFLEARITGITVHRESSKHKKALYRYTVNIEGYQPFQCCGGHMIMERAIKLDKK